MANQPASEGQSDEKQGGDDAVGEGVAELSRALDHLHASSQGLRSSQSAAALLSQKLGSESRSAAPADSQTQQPAPNDRAKAEITPAQPSAGILTHAAAFDSRLALLEASMGISSSSNPFVSDGTSDPSLQPVLPALDQLTSRLAALTGLLVGTNPASAGSGAAVPGLTTPHLEALSARVRKLTTDAEALASARKRAADKAAQRITSDHDASPDTSTDDDHAAKIQALYATLPTIQSLHPLLPSVLERLRSLRACHAGAAQAADSLNELEKRHAEMASEIETWREGLSTVEEKMRLGEKAMCSNVETVEPWVRDLEARLAKLQG